MPNFFDNSSSNKTSAIASFKDILSSSQASPTEPSTQSWIWLFLVRTRGFPQAIASRPLVVKDSYFEGITNKSQSTKASCFSLLYNGPVTITLSDRSHSAILRLRASMYPSSGPTIANLTSDSESANSLKASINKSRPFISWTLPMKIISLSSLDILNFSLNIPSSGKSEYSSMFIPRGTISILSSSTPIFKYCSFSTSVKAKTLEAPWSILKPKTLSKIFFNPSFWKKGRTEPWAWTTYGMPYLRAK